MGKKNRVCFLTVFLLVTMLNFSLLSAQNIMIASVREDDRYLGREFDPKFDRLYDDFTRKHLENIEGTKLTYVATSGKGVYLTERKNHLEAYYSSTIGVTKDAPVYKVASPANTGGSYPFLVFIMKGEDGASINDLYISFRYDDNHEDIDVDLTQLYDPDLYPLPELTNEYQVYIIDLASSLDGKTFVRKDGTGEIPAGAALAGFHLLAKTTGGKGTLYIKEVYWSKDPNTTCFTDDENNSLLDDFNREVLSDTTGTTIWWRGGSRESRIIGQHLVLDYTQENISYYSAGIENSNIDGMYDNFVLKIRGKKGGENIKIMPIYLKEDGKLIFGEAKLLSELKGPDNKYLPKITNEFQNVVINFEANGWDKKVNGFGFESIDGESGIIYLDKIFFTNMEYDASTVLTKYPIIDVNDIRVFDDFEREVVGATKDYDPNNPIALENNFLYIIAYAGIDRMYIENGELVLDCSKNSDYIQYTVASNVKNNDGIYKYVVFKMRGEEGATLQNFRIKTIDPTGTRSQDVWGNGGLKSGPGLPIPDLNVQNYPYITNDGYYYIIIDLKASNLSTQIDGFDIFYSGQGKLYIDTIFFANPGKPVLNKENILMFDDFNRDTLIPADPSSINKWYIEAANATIVDNCLLLNATGFVHSYYKSAGYPNNFDEPKEYFVLKMKGEEGTTLESFRISVITDKGESPERFANQGQLVSSPYVPIAELTEDFQEYIIDLQASNLPVRAQGVIITFGDWSEGKLYIDEIYFADKVNLANLLNQVLND